MGIDKITKKRITDDWGKAFPYLSNYSQSKLYKVVGPLVTGLELIKLPRTEEYRPYFVIYPLWEKNVAESLDIPIVLKQYYNKKNLQIDISYEKHSNMFEDVIDNVREQTPSLFDNDIPLNKILSVLDDYSKTPPLSASPLSYLQAVLFEAKLKIYLYLSIDYAKLILNEIRHKEWNKAHFKACGVDVSNWILDLHEAIENRDEFLKLINLNRQDKKIAKLQSSELIP